jgi:IclR family acetate operon transcriptional repressor
MRAVTVTLQVIEAVATSGPVGVSDLSRQLALPKSTVQRSLLAAASAGWLVASDDEPTRWTVSPRVLGLVASRVAPDLCTIARPHLTALRDEVGDAVHLVIGDDGDVVLIERLLGTHPVQVVVPLGFRVPMHAGATGKAMLAALDESEIGRALPAHLAALTDATIVDRDALVSELAIVRQRGYATNVGEWDATVAAVAAAIVTGDGVVHGAISVSTTPARLDQHRVERLGPMVRDVADAIAVELVSSVG